MGRIYRHNGNIETASGFFRKAADAGYIPAVSEMIMLADSEEERQKWMDTARKVGMDFNPETLFEPGETELQQEHFDKAAALFKQAAKQSRTLRIPRLQHLQA